MGLCRVPIYPRNGSGFHPRVAKRAGIWLGCIAHMFDMPRNLPKYPWAEIAAYFESGHSRAECRLRFGFNAATWYTAIKAGLLRIDPGKLAQEPPRAHRNRRIHDWSAIRGFYEAGNSVADCIERFGFSPAAWHYASKRGWVKARGFWSIEQVLERAKCRTHIKQRLLRAGILENRCEWCGLTEWRGEALSIQIDHRNGIKNDNRLENLRMLCPNCHSQTKTFSARNRKSKRSKISFLVIENTRSRLA